MKHRKTKRLTLILFMALALISMLVGCGQEGTEGPAGGSTEHVSRAEDAAPSEDVEQPESEAPSESTENGSPNASDAASESDGSGGTAGETELEVCFGDDGAPFILHLYDNDTAAAIARHVGTASWRLPIYHYDDYDNWESMQYYDIPSRYEIPSDAETVTSAKGGEVYYSEPNRIVLFYHDSEISSEYTRVGYFDYTDEFVDAVENNPVLEGWNTKMVLIQTLD